ncbi:hypothetical protein BO95DRAFT_375147, partial [Aspergillus brunneoviolaceus CBS 621.78]
TTGTYDHRVWKPGLPVRSAVLKPHAGRLVVGWVTTSESLLLYVFVCIILVLIKCLHFPCRPCRHTKGDTSLFIWSQPAEWQIVEHLLSEHHTQGQRK